MGIDLCHDVVVHFHFGAGGKYDVHTGFVVVVKVFSIHIFVYYFPSWHQIGVSLALFWHLSPNFQR